MERHSGQRRWTWIQFKYIKDYSCDSEFEERAPRWPPNLTEGKTDESKAILINLRRRFEGNVQMVSEVQFMILYSNFFIVHEDLSFKELKLSGQPEDVEVLKAYLPDNWPSRFFAPGEHSAGYNP